MVLPSLLKNCSMIVLKTTICCVVKCLEGFKVNHNHKMTMNEMRIGPTGQRMRYS